MRKLLFLVMAALSAASAVRAADPPAITVRIRSVNDLADKLEYLGGLAGQAEPAKQGAQLVRQMSDPQKGIEGFDPTRPVGLYGFVSADIVGSSAVAVLPVADEATVVALLKGKLNLDPNKGDDGVYEVQVPNVPQPVFFKFANKSVYVTAMTGKPLAEAALIAPKDLFVGNEEAIASVRIYPERIPNMVKKIVLGQIEMQAAQQPKPDYANLPPEAKKVAEFGYEFGQFATMAMIKEILNSRELSVRLLVEPKTDDLTAEIKVTPGKESSLAKAIQGTNLGLTPPAGTSPLFSGNVRLSLPTETRDKLAPLIDDYLKTLAEKANENEQAKAAAKQALDAIAPSLKAGELDAALVMTGPNADGKVALFIEVKTKDGIAIDKALRELAKLAPPDAATVDFDKETVNGIAIHKITTTVEQPENPLSLKAVWIGTSEKRLLLSFEPDGALIRAAAKMAPAKVPFVAIDLSAARAMQLGEKVLKPDAVKAVMTDVFGAAVDGKDTFRVLAEGGETLTVKIGLKGKAIRFAVAVDQEKKKQ